MKWLILLLLVPAASALQAFEADPAADVVRTYTEKALDIPEVDIRNASASLASDTLFLRLELGANLDHLQVADHEPIIARDQSDQDARYNLMVDWYRVGEEGGVVDWDQEWICVANNTHIHCRDRSHRNGSVATSIEGHAILLQAPVRLPQEFAGERTEGDEDTVTTDDATEDNTTSGGSDEGDGTESDGKNTTHGDGDTLPPDLALRVGASSYRILFTEGQAKFDGLDFTANADPQNRVNFDDIFQEREQTGKPSLFQDPRTWVLLVVAAALAVVYYRSKQQA